MKNVKMLKAKLPKKKHFYYVILAAVSYGIGSYFSPVPTATATEVVSTTEEEFSEKALLQFMNELGVKYPETVLAQARLETGNFTSPIFKENHNLFGMKVAKKRPTTAIGVNRNHAQYKNWKDSVIDYALFQSYAISKLPQDTHKDYRDYIQKFYSETSDYLVRIDRAISFDKDKIALMY